MKTARPSPLLALAATLALVALTGCVMPGTKAQITALDETRKAIDRNTTANLAGAASIVSGSLAPIDKAGTDTQNGAIASDARFKKLQEDLAQQQLQLGAIAQGALAAVGEVAGTLSPGSAIAKALTIFQNRVASAEQSSGQAESASAAAKQAADAAVADAQKQIATLKSELQAQEELRKKELALALKEVAQLSAQDKEELHRRLVEEAKSRGIAGAEKMSLEQLLAALGAGGLSLAALVRTLGPSRGKKDTDDLRKEVGAKTGDLRDRVGGLEKHTELLDKRVAKLGG